jgi:hypothetical protein
MTLPKDIQIKIDSESTEFAAKVPLCAPHIAYRAGATEWAGKAQPIIELLHEMVNRYSGYAEMNGGNDLKQIKRCLIVLAKYKEVGND